MTDTQEVQTKYGTVEVETVDCDSCGNTTAKDDAYYFGMLEDSQQPIDEAGRVGYACEHCASEGPISFPPSVDVKLIPAEDVVATIIFWPVIMFIGFVRILGDPNAQLSAFHNGVITTLLWTTLPLCLLIYFGVI